MDNHRLSDCHQYLQECCPSPCDKQKMSMGILLQDHNHLHRINQQVEQPQIRLFTCQKDHQTNQHQQVCQDCVNRNQKIKDYEDAITKQKIYWKKRVSELEANQRLMEQQISQTTKDVDKENKNEKKDKYKDDKYKEKYEILKQRMDEMDSLWEQQIKEGIMRKQECQLVDEDNKKIIQQTTKVNSELRNQLENEVQKNNIREQIREKEKQDIKEWYKEEIQRIIKEKNNLNKDDELLKEKESLKGQNQLLQQSIKRLEKEIQNLDKEKDDWKIEQQKLQKQINKTNVSSKVVLNQQPKIERRVEYRVQEKIIPQIRYVKDQERENELEQQLKQCQQTYNIDLKRLKQNEQDHINKMKLLELKVEQEVQRPDLEGDLNELKLQLQSKEQQLNEMEKHKIAAQQQQYQLQKQHELVIKQNQIKYDQMIQSIENKHHNHLQSIINVNNQKTKELTLHHLQELETLKGHYQTTNQSDLNHLNAENQQFKQQIQHLNNELDQYKMKNHEIDKQKDKYKDKKKERKKIIKESDKDLKDLKKILKELEFENKKLSTSLQNLENELKIEKKGNQQMIEDKDKELKKMRDQIQKMIDLKQPTQIQIKEVEKIVEREKVKEVKFIPKEFKDQQENLIKQLGEYKALIYQQDNDIKEKKEHLKKLKKKNEKLKDLDKDQQHEIDRLRRIVNDLEQLKSPDNLVVDDHQCSNEQYLLSQIEGLKEQYQKDIKYLEKENYYLRDRNLFLESKLSDFEQNKRKVIKETRVIKEKDLQKENQLEIENDNLRWELEKNNKLIKLLEQKIDEYYKIIISKSSEYSDNQSLDINHNLKEKLLQLVIDNNALRKELNRINKAQYQKEELNLADYDIIKRGNTLQRNSNWKAIKEQVKLDKKALEDTLRNYRR